MDDENSKARVLSSIDDYIEQKINASSELIAQLVLEKIKDGDVVMTYVYDPRRRCRKLLKNYLFVLWSWMRPHVSKLAVQGKQLLRRLASEGLKCTYVDLSAVSYVMQSVTKVLLGAETMLSNGVAIQRYCHHCIGSSAFNVLYCSVVRVTSSPKRYSSTRSCRMSRVMRRNF